MKGYSVTARRPGKARMLGKSGYYFIGLLAIIILGFWKSYFFKFFFGDNDLSCYFHFHAAMMLTWMVMLIVQPILIRKKELRIHKIIGRVSYIIMPLLLISVLLVLNFNLKQADLSFVQVIFPVRDIIFLTVLFTIAVVYRHKMRIHARAMIATGVVFIEPSLARFLGGQVFNAVVGSMITWVIILTLLIILIIADRNQRFGRWMFISMLVVFVVSYSIKISDMRFPLLDAAVRWFGRLPLT